MFQKLNRLKFCCRKKLKKLEGFIMYCSPGAGKKIFIKQFVDEYNLIKISPENF